MDTSSVAYDTALSPDRIKSLAASLQQLPDAKTYKTHVTKGLQSTLFTAEQIEAERTWVDYEDVPSETQDLIGYTDCQASKRSE